MAEKANQTQEGKNNPREAFSEKLDDFLVSFRALYIRKNASGRNKFREKWPQVALYLFGERLIAFDNEGSEDLEERKNLEDEADLRRIALKEILAEFEEHSVDSGVLKLDYIGSVIDRIGVTLAQHLYADRVIERARPGLLPKTAAQPVAKVEEKLQPEERQILSNPPTPPAAKPDRRPPKGMLKNSFNYVSASGMKSVNAA